jgi:hypothetical protein
LQLLGLSSAVSSSMTDLGNPSSSSLEAFWTQHHFIALDFTVFLSSLNYNSHCGEAIRIAFTSQSPSMKHTLFKTKILVCNECIF